MTTNHDHLREVPIDADTLIATMARINTLQDELAALRKENEGLRVDIQYIAECFQAAEVEGWSEVMSGCDDPDRIRDLWLRRISFAANRAQDSCIRAAIGDSHE